QQTQVDAQRKADNIALARYRIRYASYFDVINADRALFTAELSLSPAHLNTLLSLVQLYRAVGGGWQIQELGRKNFAAGAAPAPVRSAVSGPSRVALTTVHSRKLGYAELLGPDVEADHCRAGVRRHVELGHLQRMQAKLVAMRRPRRRGGATVAHRPEIGGGL